MRTEINKCVCTPVVASTGLFAANIKNKNILITNISGHLDKYG